MLNNGPETDYFIPHDYVTEGVGKSIIKRRKLQSLRGAMGQ